MQTIIMILVDFLRVVVLSRATLQLENIALRHQVAVLKRERPRPWLRPLDRVFWVFLSRLWPHWKDALVIVKPETVIGWHRQGFRLFWKWKSCHGKPGRPRTSKEIRELIRRMSRENPLWGAPRIHGELLKLGIDVSQATVTRYMVRHPKPPSQTWRTFLDNHVGCLVSIDFFVVPTATFAVLFVFIVLRHERRHIEHFGVTAHPTADWVSQQIRDAFQAGDLTALLDWVHGLNGASRYCGAPELALLVETLETRLRTSGLRHVEALLDELYAAMTRLSQERDSLVSR